MPPNTGAQILRYDPSSGQRVLPRYVEAYQEIYASPPWNEYFGCTSHRDDHGRYGKDTTRLDCPVCGAPLGPYWPSRVILSALRNALRRQHSSLHLAMDGDRVLGFALGYTGTPAAMEENFEHPGTVDALQRFFSPMGGQELLAHLSEIGVREECRGRGIAKQLFLERLQVFRDAGIRSVITRTISSPPSAAYTWYTTKLGFRVVLQFHDDCGYVVLGARMDDLVRVLGRDTPS